MSLEVKYGKVTSQEEAWSAVKAHITPELIAKFKVKADVSYNETEKSIKATGKGFELNIQLLEDRARADIKLGLLLKALKGKVMEGIEKQLNRVV